MYVALTRAKDAIYLTSAEDYGGARKKKVSRFLMEMGHDATPVRLGAVAEGGIFASAEPHRYDLTDPHVTVPTAFSYTQLAAFETCPLQYKFAHVLHVPVFGRYQMSFGKTMHNCLQHFFETFKERVEAPQQTLFATEDAAPSGAAAIPSLDAEDV